MVYEVLIPISGSFLDQLVTTLYTDRYGTENEKNPIFKKLLEKFGTWRSLPIRLTVPTAAIVGLYYTTGQLDDTITNISLQEIFIYMSSVMFYGTTALNTINYILRRSEKFPSQPLDYNSTDD